MVLLGYDINLTFNNFISNFDIYLYSKLKIQFRNIYEDQLNIFFNHNILWKFFHLKKIENTFFIQVESREFVQRAS